MFLKHPYLRKYAVTALVLGGAVFLYWYSAFLQNIFLNFTGALEEYETGHKFLSQGLFVVLAAISAMLSPFSSAPLVPFAVVIWGQSLTIALLFLGWIIGGSLTYLLGDRIGYHILKDYVTINGSIAAYRQKLSPKTEFIIVLLFRLAMPAEIPGYVLGTIRYDFWKYLFATALAELPFAMLTVYAGEAFLEKDIFGFGAILVFISIILSAAFHLFHKSLNSRAV